ncbi:MAG TPA: hypothetical protein ENG87_01690, partial [Candidatus Pacearchaeota archaeon]|nr:hypothetical protein [Candidatus Pacearchaeota archaeon]
MIKIINNILRKFGYLICNYDTNARGVSGKELDFLIEHTPNGKIVMEIGCGYGQTTKRFADKGNIVYAIDPFL